MLAAREIWIEVCDEHGVWTEFFRHVVTTPAGDYRDDRLSRATQPLLRLLQARHSRPDHAWSELARETIASERANPLDTLPNPPFQGALEQPLATSFVRHGYLLVTGWLAHREHRIIRLTAFLDSKAPQPLIHGLSRTDVGEFFAGLRDAATSRFAGLLQIPAGLPQPVALRIFAELENGHSELVFTKRFRPVIVSGAEIDLPPLSRVTFARASWALWRAGWLKYWPAGAAFNFKTLLKTAWEEYRAHASIENLSRVTSGDRTKPPSLSARPLKVIVITHNLNLEGAPLIAFEYARYLAAQPGWSVRIVSPEDGPLNAVYAAAGLKVELIDVRARALARHGIRIRPCARPTRRPSDMERSGPHRRQHHGRFLGHTGCASPEPAFDFLSARKRQRAPVLRAAPCSTQLLPRGGICFLPRLARGLFRCFVASHSHLTAPTR